MICGTATRLRLRLWETAVLSPRGPTAANGMDLRFPDVLPVIHTLYVLRQEVLTS